MVMMDNKSYAIDFADPRGRGGRTLMVVENGKLADQRVTTVFVFGRNMSIDAVTGKILSPTVDDVLSALGHRWAIAGDSFFVGMPLDVGDDVLRIPMHGFVIEPEETRRFLTAAPISYAKPKDRR
jgi:hypothetical protein